MRLLSLANAVPPASYRQEEVHALFQSSPGHRSLRPGSREMLDRILLGDSGISKRHFATPPDELFTLDAEGLNHVFEREAPRLAVDALGPALQRAGVAGAELDALFVCTCTGYLCPGLSSFIAERAGLSSGAYLADHVGQGCGAAIPMLRAASQFLVAHPGARVACVAVEICSAAFYLDDDAGVLVSACLFADGASASVWGGVVGEGRGPQVSEFQTLHWPEQRGLLRFENRDGKLRNRLHRDVPETAARAVVSLYPGSNGRPAPRAVLHPGGKRVMEAVRALLPGQPLAEAELILRDYGNMSSPSVMFALERALESGAEGDLWLCSFGAGFTCHACRVSI